jgi:hypothetical protein
MGNKLNEKIEKLLEKADKKFRMTLNLFNDGNLTTLFQGHIKLCIKQQQHYY